MKILLKTSFTLLFLLVSSQMIYAQKACCVKNGKSITNCASAAKKSVKNSAKVCCASTAKKSVKNSAKVCCASAPKETTSGCTPSNCRGAKTKFGEAKVISTLRLELIELKAKMEHHKQLKFSDAAISVHDIIGETDDESLKIVANHVAIIESEITTLTEHHIKTSELAQNKAVQVKQLREKISMLSNLL